jgi:hypothetical protein
MLSWIAKGSNNDVSGRKICKKLFWLLHQQFVGWSGEMK